MNKRPHSSSASECNTAETSYVDSPVFETPNSQQTKTASKKKKKIEQENPKQKSMADYLKGKQSDDKSDSISIEKHLEDINAKLSNVLTKSDTSILKNLIKDTLEEVKDKFLGSLIKRLEILEGNLFDQTKEIETLQKLVKTKNNEIDILKQKLVDANLKHAEQLNDLEQYGRRNSIRIAGLPSDSENQPSAAVADEMASLLTKKLGMPIATTDIDVAHRLGKFAKNKSRPVIVKFLRRQTKIEIMKRAQMLKGSRLFINEDLTKLNAEVLASLRLKEPDLIERAWSFEGKLFVRYRGSDRRETVSFVKYREWLDKPWPQKNTTASQTYARKVSAGNSNPK